MESNHHRALIRSLLLPLSYEPVSGRVTGRVPARTQEQLAFRFQARQPDQREHSSRCVVFEAERSAATVASMMKSDIDSDIAIRPADEVGRGYC